MNKLEDFFEEDSYKELYIKNIQECKNKLTEYIQSNTPLFNFTDHGIEHSNRINEHISNLFSELLSNKDVNIRLNNSELYSLILSIYLHDVGMELINKEKIIELFKRKNYREPFLKHLSSLISCDEVNKFDDSSPEFYDFIRSNHHIISAMWIMKNNEVDSIIKLPILEDYIQIIALICYAHNEEFLTLSKEFYKSTQVNNDIIQVNILSYLLRVGDALDADKRRCKIEVLKLKNINVNSKIHWYKHYFTKSVKCENKNVSILFEFTDDEDWLDCMEEYFINETSQWIINNSDELIETKIFGDNIRNNFLKYKVESDKKYAIKQSMDKETRQAIIDIISSKKKL